MRYEELFVAIAVGFETVGAIAMVVGFVIALVLGWRALRRGTGGQQAFATLRTTLGGAILLGLEVLVAADLIRTITSKPSLEDAAILGLIVLIRTVLSISIQIEIDGVLPWRRALLTSGGEVVARAVAHDRAAAASARREGGQQPDTLTREAARGRLRYGVGAARCQAPDSAHPRGGAWRSDEGSGHD